MIKFNILVVERPNIIRSKEDFEKEHLALRRLFEKHEGGMMVRFDLTDSTINRYRENKILGSGIRTFYDKYIVETFNYASSENSYLNLLGVVDTTYVHADSIKKSDVLDKIVDTIETTAALFNYKKEDDEAIISTFDTIRKGFVEFNPDINIAKKQRDYIVVKGIPEMTIVLCTTSKRKENDLEFLKEHIRRYFMLPSIKELDRVIKAQSAIDHQIKSLKKVAIENVNSKFIELTSTSEDRITAVDEFILSIKDQKASILQVMHTLNALGKSEIKESTDKAHKSLKDVKSLDDLVKLTCVI